MKRTPASALTIALLLAAGYPLWRFVISVEEPPPTAPPRELGPVPVRVLVVAPRELVISVEAFGNLEPRRRVVIAPELTGRIVSVHPEWRPGAMVEEGDVLLALERPLYDLALREAEAYLAEAEAGVATAEVEARRAEQAREKAVLQREIAVREHERRIELGGFASDSLRDQAESARLDAESAEETASTNLEGARAALAAAGARRDRSRAAVERAREDLRRTEVRAPFRGRLVGSPPGLGTLAGPGAVLGELLDPDSLVVSARVPERDLIAVRRGMPAVVGFPSNPETPDALTLAGRVVAIDAASDPLTRRGIVEIELLGGPPDTGRAGGAGAVLGGEDAGPPVELLPAGLFARARIEVERRRAALWIDRNHFRWEGSEPVAYVIAADPENPEERRAERRVLVLVREHGEGFLVGDGIAPGERLIVHPLDRVEAGASVRRLEEPGPQTETRR